MYNSAACAYTELVVHIWNTVNLGITVTDMLAMAGLSHGIYTVTVKKAEVNSTCISRLGVTVYIILCTSNIFACIYML